MGSINLAEFVQNSFTEEASFDIGAFERTVQEGVRYLNEVLDEGKDLHPLEEQKESVEKWRQIGLGVMGVGSMLIKMQYKYGSEESILFCRQIAEILANTALEESVELAREDGTYPNYNRDAVMESDYLRKVATPSTLAKIGSFGLRNSQLLTIAPTGSISNLISVSGGIEPIYKVSYERKTETLHGEDKKYEMFDDTVEELMKKKDIKKEENLPDYVVDAHSLSWKKRINMQAAWQSYIDASISSTINLSNDTSIETVRNIYIYAWKKGLKGVTVYRDGCAREGILSGDEDLEGKQEMTQDDFISAGICPKCKSSFDQSGGCESCQKCGFDVCLT